MRLREFFGIREAEEDPTSGVPEPVEDNPYSQEPDQAAPEGPIHDDPYSQEPRGNPAGGAPRIPPKPSSTLKGPPTQQMMQWEPPPGARFGEPKPSPRRPVADPSTTNDPAFAAKSLLQRQDAPTRQIKVGAAPPEATAAVHPWERDQGLAEFFSLDEMPRPAGSIGKDMKAVISYAAQAGTEHPLSARELFTVYCRSKGISNPTKSQYVSFKTSLNRFTARSPEEVDERHPFLQQDIGRPNRGTGGDDTSTVYTYAGGPSGWGYQKPTGVATAAPSGGPRNRGVPKELEPGDDTDRFSLPGDDEDRYDPYSGESGEDEEGSYDPYSGEMGGEDEGGSYDPYSGEGGEEDEDEPSAPAPAPTVFRRRRA